MLAAVLSEHRIINAPVNVKPQGGGGGRATHGILTQTAFPWGRDFDT